MSAPKSVTKVLTKGNAGKVEFKDSVDQANYYIYELTRAALRDVGKFLKTNFRTKYYQHFKRHSGDAGRATTVKVLAGKSTTHPRLQIGLLAGKVDGFYAYFQEFGSSRTPKLGLLQNLVKDNVATIIQIESQYLSGLSEEAEALQSKVSEEEYSDED